jgi:hypothetical protein
VDFALGAVGLLQHHVGLGEPHLDVAATVVLGVAHLVAFVLHLRRIGLERAALVRNERQHFVIGADRPHGVPCLVRCLRRHGGHRLALVAALPIEQAGADELRVRRGDGIVRREPAKHRSHAGHLLGGARIDAVHPRVRVGTT